MLRVAAEDRRVKCVVSQVQLVSGFAMWKTLPEQAREAMLEAFAADRLNRFQGKEPAMLAVTSHDSSIPSALPTPDSADFFLDFKKANPENAWENKVTLRSLEHLFGYEPGAAIPHIAPTPLLMVVAKTDSLVSSDIAVKAFETAGEPKKFIMVR